MTRRISYVGQKKYKKTTIVGRMLDRCWVKASQCNPQTEEPRDSGHQKTRFRGSPTLAGSLSLSISLSPSLSLFLSLSLSLSPSLYFSLSAGSEVRRRAAQPPAFPACLFLRLVSAGIFWHARAARWIDMKSSCTLY